MDQLLRALATLLEDLDLIPITHKVAPTLCHSSPKGPKGTRYMCTRVYTYIDAGKQSYTFKSYE